ncbi:hsp90 co-chaperone Cdc37 [Xylographa opegraphella]|nr:hsp90 co-chaperone Cdc37 [Xylographa opegraphella]
MPVDYSKWDALELSDDSDFEPHPNVDKRSFIRAKQNQIHQQRAERKHHIETLKYERIINDGLLRRIDTLLTELRNHEAEASDRNAFIYQALITSAGDPDDDEPPKPPAGVHVKEDQPRYSQMMGHLVDQVKKEVDDAKPENWYKAFVKSVDGHKKKVAGLQKELNEKLSQLEKEESRKITSESIHDGFNASSVTKDKLTEKNTSNTKSKPKVEAVEVLNPASLKRDAFKSQDEAQSSGADADTEGVDDPDDTDETLEPTALGKQFGKIRMGDYGACLQFISEHRQVLAERETDGLLIMAFHAEEKGDSKLAKQYVHHALLLQYCRSLGGDGVRLFFKRVTTQGHQAQKVFLDDVNNTYQRMKTRTAELNKERQTEVETIQLQAVEPGTEIHFNIPQPDSEEEIEQQARAIFETFPPGLQRALESGSLDRVNEVLGKMSIEEAEEIVGQLGESGMLDMRQGVIDTTTEEGKEELKQIHEQQEEELAKHGEDIEIAHPD